MAKGIPLLVTQQGYIVLWALFLSKHLAERLLQSILYFCCIRRPGKPFEQMACTLLCDVCACLLSVRVQHTLNSN